MKFLTGIAIAVALSFCATAIASTSKSQDVIEGSVLLLEAPNDSAATSVLLKPATEPLLLGPPITAVAPVSVGCDTCCQKTCCRKPEPTIFCLEDLCGCTHEACIEVPACCVGQAPTIRWRTGVFGRQVATLCWECCDHKVKVIITRKGKVKVRD